MWVNSEKMSYGTKKDTIHTRPQIYHQAVLSTILRTIDHIPDFNFFFLQLGGHQLTDSMSDVWNHNNYFDP